MKINFRFSPETPIFVITNKEKNIMQEKLSQLEHQLSEQEYFRKMEIQTTGYVTGRTFKKIAKLKKAIEQLIK